MMKPMSRASRKWFSAWFSLTREERWLAAGILGLFLLGLTARYLYLKAEIPVPMPHPTRVESTPTPRGQE
jgi:hypothetical protein